MTVTAQCEFCQKTITTRAEHAGKKIRCPGCKGPVQLPPAARMSLSEPAPRTSASASQRRTPSAGNQAARRQRPQGPSGQQVTEHSGTTEHRGTTERRAPQRRRRTQSRPDPDDIWSQPLSSHGTAIDPEDYANFGLPPRKKKQTDRDDYRSGGSDYESTSFMGPMMFCAIACGICVLLALAATVVGKSAPDMGKYLALPATVLGGLLYVGGGLKILGNAFAEDTMCGFMYLFIPFYALFFVITRWDVNARPLMIAIMGVVTMVTGLACGSG